MYPTTRYGRFIVRQNRYRKRYLRWRKNRRRVERLHFHGHTTYRRSSGWATTPGLRGKQTGYRLKKAPRHGPLIVQHFPFGIVVTAAKHRKPPHAARIYLPTGALAAGPIHPWYARVGYVRRPARYFGRKFFKQTARDRVIRAASYFARLNGALVGDGSPQYPWWDPLHRTPVWDDTDGHRGEWTRFENPPLY